MSGILASFSTTRLNLEDIRYWIKRELSLAVEHTKWSWYTHVIIPSHKLHLGSIHQVNEWRFLHFCVLTGYLFHSLQNTFLVLKSIINALFSFWFSLVLGVTNEGKSCNKTIHTNGRVLNVYFFETSRQTICIAVIIQLVNLRGCLFLFYHFFGSGIDSSHEARSMMRCHLDLRIFSQSDRSHTKSSLFRLMIACVRLVCCGVEFASHLLLITLFWPNLHLCNFFRRH
jgi:hypothetical protein